MPCNYSLYPSDWKEIRARILERAHYCCEGSPLYPDCRAVNHQPHPVTGSKVILTVAHLDHNPESSDETRMRAWCNRCHLAYDRYLHSKNSRTTRLKKKNANQGELFDAAYALF